MATSEAPGQAQKKASSQRRLPIFFVEQRDAAASKAPNLLTCFGGKRERDEDPLECIKRECHEELSWVPSNLKRAVDLYVDNVLIAWFYHAIGPSPEQEAGLVFESERGRTGLWIQYNDPRLSGWHAIVFEVRDLPAQF